jgi:hypothetical protein
MFSGKSCCILSFLLVSDEIYNYASREKLKSKIYFMCGDIMLIIEISIKQNFHLLDKYTNTLNTPV